MKEEKVFVLNGKVWTEKMVNKLLAEVLRRNPNILK
jgi:hypothetical protein